MSDQVTKTPFLTIAPPLTVTTTSLAAGSVGVEYTKAIGVSGGNPPYIWSLGGAPAGLAITSIGILYGTPAQAGTFQIVITLKDTSSAGQATATKTLPLAIAGISYLSSGSVGAPYSQQLAVIGGTPPFAWSATGLPQGFTLSAGGLLSGTPTQSPATRSRCR
ncbi:MAG: hypothetical protein ABSC23_18430 [Bryobacteraceae bacterium]